MAVAAPEKEVRAPPRARMTGTERRQQLVEIAKSLFAERGYDATSIEEIAQRANVSKPVVYEHFGGKEGLYAVVVDREMSALLDGITSSLTNNRSRVRVERVALALLTYVEERTDGFRILIRDSPRPASPPARIRACSTTPSARWRRSWPATSPAVAWTRSWRRCTPRPWSVRCR